MRLPVALFMICFVAPLSVSADPWPQWRGPGGMGVSDERGMPVEWDAETNVLWKAKLPGPGNSTPVVWDEHVFVSQATDEGKVRSLICFNRGDGSVRWTKSIEYDGNEPTHKTNPYAASSPTTDGKLVYVWHGSAGLYAYDFNGERKWRQDTGDVRHIWGYASSPAIVDDKVILSAGPGLEHHLLAFNKTTGEPVWKRTLEAAQSEKVGQFKGSWSTPVVYEAGGKTQLLLSLPKQLHGIDPATGKTIWTCDGLSDLVYTSPLHNNKVIVAMSGYGGPGLAMRAPGADDTGDLTESHRLWVHPKNPQRVGSGVILGEHLYILNEPGVAYCIALESGEQLLEGRGQRLSGRVWSSFVLADGKLWINTDRGETLVLKPSPQGLEVIANNRVNELMRASPVFSDGQVFLRTYQHLYCIGKRKQDATD